MNVSRFVSLTAAVAITATQWAAFSDPPVSHQSVPATAAPAANAVSRIALALMVILADRHA